MSGLILPSDCSLHITLRDYFTPRLFDIDPRKVPSEFHETRAIHGDMRECSLSFAMKSSYSRNYVIPVATCDCNSLKPHVPSRLGGKKRNRGHSRMTVVKEFISPPPSLSTVPSTTIPLVLPLLNVRKLLEYVHPPLSTDLVSTLKICKNG